MNKTDLADLRWLLFAVTTILCFILMFMAVRLASGEVTPFLFAFIANFVNCIGHLVLIAKARISGRVASFSLPGLTLAIALITGICVASNDYSAVYMFKNGAPLSIAMPVFTAGNVFLTVMFGLFVMKERLYLKRILGLICIIAGIILLNV